MAMKAIVKARIDKELKEEVTEILNEIGLTTSQAIQLFMRRVKSEKGIPFDLKIPNAETLQAMKEVENGETETISFEDHMEEMKSCITN